MPPDIHLMTMKLQMLSGTVSRTLISQCSSLSNYIADMTSGSGTGTAGDSYTKYNYPSLYNTSVCVGRR
jgi:hypothetical protein